MIKHALDNDAKHVVISLGGIDSFDAGAGMLQALGAQFYDDEGRVVDMRQGAGVIKYIRRMDMSNLHPKMETARIQVMSDFSSRLYGKQSEIMQTYDAHQLNHNQAAEIDNLIWYFSELFKSELKIAIGPVERGGAGGGIAAVLKGLYQAEILTSHALVDQLTHLENLVEQADLIIFGEGLNENDQLLETTTLRIADFVINIKRLPLQFVQLLKSLIYLNHKGLQQCLIHLSICRKVIPTLKWGYKLGIILFSL
ncbi:putative glycerate kinase [Staphylococcus aureus 08BA02176]|nr:putative glycerate kinase [Staphylococcus aureus 08BA02176]